jgi:hypothetical protein
MTYMKTLTPEILDKAVTLILRLRSGEFDDDGINAIIDELDELFPDPDYLDYTIDRVPELTPEEVVRKAFSYKPIQL